MFCGLMSRWTISMGWPAVVLLAVRVLEGGAHLAHDVGGDVERDLEAALLGPPQDRAQVAPVHVLHRDVVALLQLAEVEHLDDVRVGEAGHHLGLVDEHVHELLVVGEVGQDALDRDDLLEPFHARALGPEHLGHAADGHPLEQAVGAVVAGAGEGPALRPAASSSCRRRGGLGQDLGGRRPVRLVLDEARGDCGSGSAAAKASSARAARSRPGPAAGGSLRGAAAVNLVAVRRGRLDHLADLVLDGRGQVATEARRSRGTRTRAFLLSFVSLGRLPRRQPVAGSRHAEQVAHVFALVGGRHRRRLRLHVDGGGTVSSMSAAEPASTRARRPDQQSSSSSSRRAGRFGRRLGAGSLSATGGAGASSTSSSRPSGLPPSSASARSADSAGSENASRSAATSSGSFSPRPRRRGERRALARRARLAHLDLDRALPVGRGRLAAGRRRRVDHVAEEVLGGDELGRGGLVVVFWRRRGGLVVASGRHRGPEGQRNPCRRDQGQDSQLGRLSQRLCGSYVRLRLQ